MDIAALIARLLLFGVFAVAGLAKLSDKAGSRQALQDFGVPLRPAKLFGPLLPLAELATGVALIPVVSARTGAFAALFLLLVFVVGISINLALGRTPDCHCFGQLHSTPVGWSTLGRNSLLAGVAGFVAWEAGRSSEMSVFGWMLNLTLAQRAELVVGIGALALLAAQCAFLMQVLRQQGRVVLRLDAVEARILGGGGEAVPQTQAFPQTGLPPGRRAPGFNLMSVEGGFATLSDLLVSQKPALLLFTNPKCGPCQALAPDVARWHQEYSSKLNIVLISEGNAKDNEWRDSGGMKVLLQNKREVAEAYQAYGTPSAVLIQGDGNVGSFLAQGADGIRALVAQTVGAPSLAPMPVLPSSGGQNGGNGKSGPQPVAAAKMGDPVPALKFKDLNGSSVALKKLRGRTTLLLFWNPDCGFCQQMLDDLRAWESNTPPKAPDLLVVSRGTIEANRAMNLRSRVILDSNFEAGRAFGAGGTPMAVLLNTEARVASEVAAGAAAVFALATPGLSQAANR